MAPTHSTLRFPSQFPLELFLEIVKHSVVSASQEPMDCLKYVPEGTTKRLFTVEEKKLLYWSVKSVADVCRRWRVICLSTPSLWSNITVPFYGDVRSQDMVFDLNVFNHLKWTRFDTPLHISVFLGAPRRTSYATWIFLRGWHSLVCRLEMWRSFQLVGLHSDAGGSIDVLFGSPPHDVYDYNIRPIYTTSCLKLEDRDFLRSMPDTIWNSTPLSVCRDLTIYLRRFSMLSTFTAPNPIPVYALITQLHLHLCRVEKPRYRDFVEQDLRPRRNGLMKVLNFLASGVVPNLHTLSITLADLKFMGYKRDWERTPLFPPRQQVKFESVTSLILDGRLDRPFYNHFTNKFDFPHMRHFSMPLEPLLSSNNLLLISGSALTTLQIALEPRDSTFSLEEPAILSLVNLEDFTVMAYWQYGSHPLITQLQDSAILPSLSRFRYAFVHEIMAAYDLDLESRQVLAEDLLQVVQNRSRKLSYADIAVHYHWNQDYELVEGLLRGFYETGVRCSLALYYEKYDFVYRFSTTERFPFIDADLDADEVDRYFSNHKIRSILPAARDSDDPKYFFGKKNSYTIQQCPTPSLQ